MLLTPFNVFTYIVFNTLLTIKTVIFNAKINICYINFCFILFDFKYNFLNYLETSNSYIKSKTLRQALDPTKLELLCIIKQDNSLKY